MSVIQSTKTTLRNCLGSENYYSLVNAWHRLNGRKRSLIEKARDWKVYQNEPNFDPVLREMLATCEAGQKENQISDYWKELINKNVSQLMDSGFENFKQTVALNYFTWLLSEDNPQVKFLRKNLPADVIAAAEKKAKDSPKHSFFDAEQSEFYNFITILMWEYVKQEGGQSLLEKLEEPLTGNSPAMKINGKWFSQDLANSILEYQTITNGVGDMSKIRTIVEIGAGYGRTSYVILKLNQGIRYIIADIPPALYISQRYLTSVFPDRKVFAFRDFENFADIEQEFMSSDIIFLMPFQLAKLPDHIADLGVAIDCFHEMLPAKIDVYFRQIDRLAEHLFFKCWKKTTIPFDKVTLTEKDYPIRPHWNKNFSRECRVQSTYFESFYSWNR